MQHTLAPTRLFDIVGNSPARRRQHPIFIHRGQQMTLGEYADRAERLACALLTGGLQRGDVVAMLCENRPEWNVVDLAVMQAGGVLLPLCMGLTAEEYVESLSKSGARLLVVENEAMLSRFRLLIPQIENIREVVSIDPIAGIPSLDGLLAGEATAEASTLLRQRMRLCTADDPCTLFYHGGGTFIHLTHKEMLQEVSAFLPAEHGRRRTLTGHVPLCTKYGRAKNYAHQMLGHTIAYPCNDDLALHATTSRPASRTASRVMKMFDIVF